MPAERVQKILAQAGLASRRKAEDLIKQGLVTINGKVAKLGDKASAGKDAIKVEGKLISSQEPAVYIIFNKPKLVISMMADPQGRPTIADYMSQVRSRLFPIGRLDFSSEGLILLTNDGDLAEQINKSPTLPRVYHVKVKGHPDAPSIERLQRGVRVGGKLVKPHSVRLSQDLTSKSKVEIVMIGAGAIDIKSMFETKGFVVDRIVRTAIGHLTLHGLPPGKYRHLKKSQIEALVRQPELGIRQVENTKVRGISERNRERHLAAKGIHAEPVITPASELKSRPSTPRVAAPRESSRKSSVKPTLRKSARKVAPRS